VYPDKSWKYSITKHTSNRNFIMFEDKHHTGIWTFSSHIEFKTIHREVGARIWIAPVCRNPGKIERNGLNFYSYPIEMEHSSVETVSELLLTHGVFMNRVSASRTEQNLQYNC
jgi:hypothetical protein